MLAFFQEKNVEVSIMPIIKRPQELLCKLCDPQHEIDAYKLLALCSSQVIMNIKESIKISILLPPTAGQALSLVKLCVTSHIFKQLDYFLN